MDRFELFAHGKNFDVDTYLETATLSFDRVWHAGEGHYQTSGVAKSLGDGTSLPVRQQEELAVEFLAAHQAALQDLSQQPGVDTFILGIHLEMELTPSLLGFPVSPSPRLMWHCRQVGARPVYFVTLARVGEYEQRFSELFGCGVLPSTGSQGAIPKRKGRGRRRRA
jgi:hypothetical protein